MILGYFAPVTMDRTDWLVVAELQKDCLCYMSYQGRPTKASDSRSKKWTGGDSVELDAIPPARLRQMVRDRIERHVDQHQLEVLKVAEQSEREALKAFARKVAS